MENFNTTLTSLEDMSYPTGMGNDTMYIFDSYRLYLSEIQYVINLVTLCIELPVIRLALFALYHQAKAGHVTHVFVINLLISDLIQIIGRLMRLLQRSRKVDLAGHVLFVFGLGASILFMMCIALERYLLVVHPLWYRYRRTIKHSILISLAAYVVDLLFSIVVYLDGLFLLSPAVLFIAYITFFILPLPFLVFCLVATWRALSDCISVSHQEKKRILGTLALVLLIYFVMIFPTIYLHLFVIPHPHTFALYGKIHLIAFVFLYMSPLMDALLYILIKKDASYTLVPHCCRRLCTHT